METTIHLDPTTVIAFALILWGFIEYTRHSIYNQTTRNYKGAVIYSFSMLLFMVHTPIHQNTVINTLLFGSIGICVFICMRRSTRFLANSISQPEQVWWQMYHTVSHRTLNVVRQKQDS